MAFTCLDLALQGERLCNVGDCGSGVQFFEAAMQVGTDDLNTLSAIYSQLGNAYFYLNDYVKALEYHKHDLNLARCAACLHDGCMIHCLMFWLADHLCGSDCMCVSHWLFS